MDWKQILSLSNEHLTDEQKEKIYNELVKDQKFDSKIAKKLFPLCLTVLKYKGQQVEKQHEEIEMLASSDIDLKSTLEQIEKQKKLINKYESERVQFKTRIKELSDEMAIMHGRELQGSDDDSPSQLSEIDRQQELMGAISSKNKHIKRLLRDIEKLEQQSTSYLNVIKELKANVVDANEKISLLSTQLEESAGGVTFLEEKIAQLSTQLHELQNENQQLLRERQEREKEMENFSKQLEERVLLYKGILDGKQRELDIMNERYENLIEQVPGIDVDSEESEVRRLMQQIKERDKVIAVFEEKIHLLSTELIDSTDIIKKLNDEREEFAERLAMNNSSQCCEEIEQMLKRSNEERKELQQMLQSSEDGNVLKSRQLYEATLMIKSYENSQDGLSDALKKIHKLQEAVQQRDNQIQEFVTELNAQNEVIAENSILRKRLGIPEDDIVETKAFLAKQKRYAKINDRLMLKLRSSEELRLQLKIDKNDLKRKISELEEKLNKLNGDDNSNSASASISSDDVDKGKKGKKESRVEMKQCENCLNSYNVYESLKYCRNCIMKHNTNLCENCTANVKVTSSENIELIKKIAKLEIDYQSIIDENDCLRVGLNEILEKLRDYEDSSEKRTIINPATLEKLLYILNLRDATKLSSGICNKVTSDVSNSNLDNKHAAIDKNNENDENETLQLKLLIKDLSDENNEIKLELDNMRHVEEQYQELVRCSELCDDEKYRLVVRSLERCHSFETNLESYERKIDFLKSENDNLHREIRTLKVSSLDLMNDMKIEILNKQREIVTVKSSNYVEHEKDEILKLEEDLHEMRLKLNGLCFNVLKNIKSLDEENLLKIDTEKLSNVTILENNLTTSFITRIELNQLKSKLLNLQETINKHEIREKQLEELAKISQQQLKLQQLMLSQFSDDEIAARHLIVDLQSQSNESYLLTKTARDLKISKENEDQLKFENDKLKSEIGTLQENLQKAQNSTDEKVKELRERENSNLLKIQYLQKSLIDLCNQYSSMTPMYLITDFIKCYVELLDAKKEFDVDTLKIKSQSLPEISNDFIVKQLKEMSMTDIEAKIEIIKYKSSCDYFKQQLELYDSTIKELHNEIARIKMNEIKSTQHWNAIRMLFNNEKLEDNESSEKVEQCDKEVQVDVTKNDCGTITDKELEKPAETLSQQSHIKIQDIPVSIPEIEQRQLSQSIQEQIASDEQNSLELKLKKALSLASSRSSLLIETENCLSEAQGRIKILEKNLENQMKQRKNEQHQSTSTEAIQKEDHILSVTIATLQNLILDKDTNLSRYQELLKSERQHNMRTFDELSEQIKQLKKVNDGYEMTIYEKDKTIEKLKQQIIDLKEENLKIQTAEKPASPVLQQQQQSHVTFKDNNNEHDIEIQSMEKKLKDAHTDMKKMEQELKDLVNTEKQLKNTIREKDILIKDLNIKLKLSNDSLESFSENFTSHSEIEQLREMLEEKDKHIQDLSDTLNQFHEDQQKYINDSALNSAEQVHIISANLTRAETSNRVLTTQLEALKRQVTNIQQREKQSRDMIKTLKNQLIKRPVISVKSDKRPSTTREEQQQKRINELENELLEVKDELRRQVNINDNKKAKNAAELGLWEKQKRYQEMSEKLKAKLTEKEIDCERFKANLQMAKNNVKRLENEKIMLENKLKNGRFLQNVGSSTSSTTCHNYHYSKHSQIPETPSIMSVISDSGSEINNELIVALKSRIESQQRRIIAMEFEGKGNSAYTAEIEKLQEQLSEFQARNIRLEAKNIQLQLDVDLLKQNDGGQRQEARIKHLEDYVMVLKDELAKSHITTTSEKSKHSNDSSSTKIHAMEQTILNLKLIIEKLQAENKYLRNGKHVQTSIPQTSTYMSHSDRKKEEIFEKLKIDYEKLQKNYNEVVSKISQLKVELELSQAKTINASCPHCNEKDLDELATQDVDSLRQQLQQKVQLLEKAKSLLTRAAAKEKHLRDIITSLRRKIYDLEGVPVISEENSETGL